ncbi:hypothetical protein Tdes44962_MAKER07116 [Teratosphaeria destructans]|uniref:Uncharacterized protein n=1 Tax=Teratosphaeria destructans TaxID=418781 RepID=A0A9W7T025_9PEZI|nr:hypothetical protein Tdes44962_MAKER07116 [Teratosphaeria destructans]
MSAQAVVDPPQGHVFDTDWENPFGIKRASEVWVFEMRVASGMLVETSERHLGYHDLTKTEIEEAFNYLYKDWLKTRRDYKRRAVPYPNIHKQTSEGRRDSRAIAAPWVWIKNLDTNDQTIIEGRDRLRQKLIQRIKAAVEHVRNNPGEVERNWNAGEADESDEEGADAEEMMTSDAPQPQGNRNTVVDDIDNYVVASGRGDQERDANRSTRRNPVRATARSARYNESISDNENSNDEDLDGEIGRQTKRRRVASDPDANLERSRGGLSSRPLINSFRSPYHIKDVVAAVAAKPQVPLHLQKRA